MPNYSTLSRRAKSLRATLPVLRKTGEAVHLLVDSTGLKLFGEGEWKVRKHGYSKRRSWRKVHLALDAKTVQMCAVLMTHRDVDDASVLPELLIKQLLFCKFPRFGFGCVGGWRLAVGGWRLAVGGWRLAVGGAQDFMDR